MGGSGVPPAGVSYLAATQTGGTKGPVSLFPALLYQTRVAPRSFAGNDCRERFLAHYTGIDALARPFLLFQVVTILPGMDKNQFRKIGLGPQRSVVLPSPDDSETNGFEMGASKLTVPCRRI